MSMGCGVVRDLLPLYVDGVASEETKAAIEAHLADCKACEAIFADLHDRKVSPPQFDDNALTDQYNKVARRIRLRWAIIMLALLLAGIFLGILTGSFNH